MTQFNSKLDYSWWLRRHNFQVIGYGAYSSVHAKDGADWCLKVGRESDGWLRYIQWADTKGQLGKLAPMVYNIKHHSNFYVASMEQLVCTLSEIGHEYSVRSSSPFRCEQYRDANTIIDGGWSTLPYELAEYRRQISDELRADDLHLGNQMLRKDGQLVITDPLSRQDKTTRSFKLKHGRTKMTFDFSQEAFRSSPTNKTAGDYLSTAAKYAADDMIADDTLLNAVAEVAYWLTYGRQMP